MNQAWPALALALVMGLMATGPSPAQNDPITHFYADPRPERLVGVLDGFAKSPRDWNAYPPMVGFFAVIFRRYPDWTDRLVPARFDAKTATTVVAALMLSGQTSIPQALRARLAEPGQDPNLRAELATLPLRLEDLNVATPTQLDLLWGAFFASGEGRYVNKILDFFARTANRSADIALDVNKITVAMTGGPKDVLGQMKNKHGEALLRELIYAASAQWALASNARQHPIVNKTVEAYIASHPGSLAAQSLAAAISTR